MRTLTRRKFLRRSFLSSAGLAMGSLMNVPGFLQQALAGDAPYAWNGKKIIFIFLRGGNDGLNTVIPSGDPGYNSGMRPNLYIPAPSAGLSNGGIIPNLQAGRTIDLGNGFAALHPSLSDLISLYNSGELAVLHRVGYPNQSRSHFDSENYWETGVPNDDHLKEGLFYRTIVKTGLDKTQVLPAVTLQNTMPLLLRGDVPMANIDNPSRFDLLGVYAAARQKHIEAISRMHKLPHPAKNNRDLLFPTGQRFVDAIDQVQGINFNENGLDAQGAKIPGSPFLDSDPGNTHLFPLNASTDDKGFDSYSAYNFFRSLKSSAQILANTDAVVTGTELSGFDTHNNQGGANGGHARLMARLGYGIYALKQFFSHPDINMWEDVCIVTLSEFGRTTDENGSAGTDHAEAGPMFVASGNPLLNGGVFQCDASSWATGAQGAMYEERERYLARRLDYRSVMGEMIRRHLGVHAQQLREIIPGYGIPSENLLAGGLSIDGTPIVGEPGIFA